MGKIVPPTTRAAKSLPPVQCFPWCIHQSGHTEPGLDTHQWCTPADEVEPITLYPSVEQQDGTFAPDVIRIQGRVNHQGLAARLHVGLGYGYGFEVTVAEARRVAATMVALADKMEDGR